MILLAQKEYLRDLLIKHNQTVSVAESLTGGHLQYLMSSVNGSSGFFVGGLTAYNIDQKVALLKVDPLNAKECNCVSDQTSIEMAMGIQHLMNSTYSIATTGYSVPNDKVDRPHAYVTIFDVEDGFYIVRLLENRDFENREQSQQYFSERAYMLFYRYLMNKLTRK